MGVFSWVRSQGFRGSLITATFIAAFWILGRIGLPDEPPYLVMEERIDQIAPVSIGLALIAGFIGAATRRLRPTRD